MLVFWCVGFVYYENAKILNVSSVFQYRRLSSIFCRLKNTNQRFNLQNLPLLKKTALNLTTIRGAKTGNVHFYPTFLQITSLAYQHRRTLARQPTSTFLITTQSLGNSPALDHQTGSWHNRSPCKDDICPALGQI